MRARAPSIVRVSDRDAGGSEVPTVAGPIQEAECPLALPSRRWQPNYAILGDFRRDQQYSGDRPSVKRRHHAVAQDGWHDRSLNLPVISHGVPETHVHLVGAAPNGLSVEYMPRLFPLWKEVP